MFDVEEGAPRNLNTKVNMKEQSTLEDEGEIEDIEEREELPITEDKDEDE